MSIDWGTVASVGIGAAIGIVGSISTTFLAHWFSRQREQDAFNRRKEEDATRAQINSAVQLGTVYTNALETAYAYRSLDKDSIDSEGALKQVNYYRVVAELNLLCQSHEVERAWRKYMFQPDDDSQAVRDQKKMLTELMRERLGSISENNKN